MINLNKLQIETTTRCTLKCPACSRTWWAETLRKKVPIYDIDPSKVYNFLNCDTGKKIKILDLRGDWGDSIYYPKLFDFIDLFRAEKKFNICTNGSNQTEKFWNNLASRLDEKDTVEFSIDGLEDTNHLYRKNSNWKSIMLGLDIIRKSKAKIIWKTNIFKFNAEILAEIKKFAESKGAIFISKSTHRWGEESLRPPEHLIESDMVYKPDAKIDEIEAGCKTNLNWSISAYHMFMPCGWFCAPQVLYKSSLWTNKEKWNIKDTTLDEIRETVLLSWTKNIEENPASASILCKTKCRKKQII
jgi:MoaA/NifB/PqqE/SkfB family radical SAM enzyme